MADNFDDDDDVGEKGAGAVVDQKTRALHGAIQFHAQNQYFRQLKQLCSHALASDPTNLLLQFWLAFGSHKSGDHDAAITLLTPLAEEKDLALASVALLLAAHNARPGKDKKTLLELKSRLKVVSKQSTELSLQLAGRYFLCTHKIPKSRQCIEKLLAKNKKDVELLALFGWIYLQSGDDKYIEKSMQVFKKAAKLSLPNFDIASLLGRAKYFEYESKLAKSVQALDSILKLHPQMVPALEEKMRLLAMQSKWKEAARVREEVATVRRQTLGAGDAESLASTFVVALEAFLTTADEAQHDSTLRALVNALRREEEAGGACYWSWQHAQTFARLARSPPTSPVWRTLADLLAPHLAASASQKGGPNVNLAYEAAFVSFRRGEYASASAGFAQVAAAALAVEKAEKDDEEKGDAATAAAPKVNEEERYQKAQAAAHAVLVLLAQGEDAAARAALDALPTEVRRGGPGGDAPLNSVLYAEVLLARRGGVSPASKVIEYLDAHLQSLKDRSPTQATLTTATNNAVTGLARFYVLCDPDLLVRVVNLYLDFVGVTIDEIGRVRASSRPSAEEDRDLRTQASAALRHLTSPSLMPGHFAAIQAQAVLAWIDEDDEAAQEAAERCTQLVGATDPRIVALRVLLRQRAEGATPSKPSQSSAHTSPAARTPVPAVPAAAPVAPNTAQRKEVVRAVLREEGGLGLDFDDDAEEDVDALFKNADEAAAATVTNDAEAEARAEREAQAMLDEMESRASAAAARREADARAADAREAARRAAAASLAEEEAAAALEKASRKDALAAEARKAEEIAALRLARENERRRQAEELERAEREREEQRERDRADHEATSSVQTFSEGLDSVKNATRPPPPLNTGFKWNRPSAETPSAARPDGLTPLSLATGGTPLASPLSSGGPASGSFRVPAASPTSAASASPAPAGSDPKLTVQQSAHLRQVEAQRSEEARLAAEKREKIMIAGQQIDQAKKFTKVAFWGEVFKKHGRRGAPHERNVTLEVTGSELKFDWSSGQLKAHKNNIQLLEGKATPVFARTTADKARVERCFSIVTASRTLDLEAPSDQTKEYWVTGISLLLKYLRD